jgi:isopenicillin-N epimerase
MSLPWLLNPQIHYLNHGSYGATPLPILEYQQKLRQQLENQPIHFFARELEALLDRAKESLGSFISAPSPDLVFLPNATWGINTILRSLPWVAGEEILITNHTYNACSNAVNFLQQSYGVIVKQAFIPFPLTDASQIREAILEQITPQTKLALLDHVTSSTALIFPLDTLISELHQRGVDTLVDGAHAPGFLPLDITALAPTYYTGNCHKWLCAPKGSAFLYVRPDKQKIIRPLVISHGANSPRSDHSRFQLEFAWLGTDDPTAYLCVPAAIEWLGNLFPQGWPQLLRHNYDLTRKARHLLGATLEIPPPAPESLLGSMATLPLGKISLLPLELYQKLREEYAIEVPIIPWENQQVLIRISAQVYNHLEQYEYLAATLKKILSI